MNKKAFTLVELAIVIAVIAALSVALVSSQELIESARINSFQRRLFNIEQNINQYSISHIPGYYTSYAQCEAKTGNPQNFCSTLSSAQGATTGGMFGSSIPSGYQMNVELSLKGIIDPMPMFYSGSDLAHPANRAGVEASIPGFTTNVTTVGLQWSATVQNWTTFIGTGAYKHWADILPSFDSRSAYNITFSAKTTTGSMTYILNNSPYSSFQTSYLPQHDPIGGKLAIHVFSKNPEASAALTSRMAFKLDQKMDTGNPSTGRLIPGRMFTTYGGATNTCFNGSSLTSTGCALSFNTSLIGTTSGQIHTTSFACFNSAAVGTGGEHINGFFIHNSANANTHAKYTAAVTANNHLIQTGTGTMSTGMTDATRKALVRRAERDYSMGCNIAYFTNSKW